MPFTELRAPYPRNWRVFDKHMAWQEHRLGEHKDELARLKFARDVFEDLNALETTEGKGAA